MAPRATARARQVAARMSLTWLRRPAPHRTGLDRAGPAGGSEVGRPRSVPTDLLLTSACSRRPGGRAISRCSGAGPVDIHVGGARSGSNSSGSKSGSQLATANKGPTADCSPRGQTLACWPPLAAGCTNWPVAASNWLPPTGRASGPVAGSHGLLIWVLARLERWFESGDFARVARRAPTSARLSHLAIIGGHLSVWVALNGLARAAFPLAALALVRTRRRCSLAWRALTCRSGRSAYRIDQRR